MGFTPELVTGVWVGNTNNEQMKKSFGSTAAAPLWHDFMEDVYKTIAPFKDTKPTVLPPAGRTWNASRSARFPG